MIYGLSGLFKRSIGLRPDWGRQMANRSFCSAMFGIALAGSLTACASAMRNEPSLGQVKALAKKYRNVNVAKAEGYTTDHKCTTAEMLGFPAEQGAMGLHYVRRDLLGLPPKPAPPGSQTTSHRSRWQSRRGLVSGRGGAYSRRS